ncbi:hypothetical protein DCAR_0934334 [Daucus carota subsp. sativus]|uniref:Uncharacterized protein n=1 Tax=Daucus carota subsp. sativus TaxID=79200 RepID=A0A175YF88_DAUCS|nr:hypothetical protein DCAR_0934334 [Daucus carota subsp. sativus]
MSMESTTSRAQLISFMLESSYQTINAQVTRRSQYSSRGFTNIKFSYLEAVGGVFSPHSSRIRIKP